MTLIQQLKDRIAKRLPELDLVIGWGRGFDPLHHTPIFIKKPEDIDKLVWDELCVHNLATYLTRYGAGKRVGVVVKGCDSRSVVELTQEKLIARENVVVFGLPCQGVASLSKIRTHLEAQGLNLGMTRSFALEGGEVKLTVQGRDVSLPFAGVMAGKCLRCEHHDAIGADEFVGEPLGRIDPDTFEDLARFEAMTLDERMNFWREQMERCIRCYACRNACPLCVCRDHCIAQSRDPAWVSQRDGLDEKFFFQMIHATHLAGRCTGCGECQRACPVGIPVLLFKRQLNKDIKELFDYKAGTDPQAKPPLLAFKVHEDNINERGW